MLERKAPESKVRFALMLDPARARVALEPSAEVMAQASVMIKYAADMG